MSVDLWTVRNDRAPFEGDGRFVIGLLFKMGKVVLLSPMLSKPPFFDDYIGALFRGPRLPPWMEWGILTAENPGGITMSPAENKLRDAELKRRLEDAGLPHLRMSGYSPVGDYAESGWAVACAPKVLRSLAESCGQLGVYEIRGDALFLVYLSPFAEFPIGGFAERFSEEGGE